jgi:hypothetical protein
MRLLRTFGVLAALVALTLAGLWITRGAPTTRASGPPSTGSGSTTTLGVVPPSFTVAPFSLIATLHGATPCYASSTSPTVTGSVAPSWSGATLGLPVIGMEHERLHIRLLQRPNDLTAWIAAPTASLTHTGYHVVVDLSAKRLLLYERSKLVLQAPAVVGSAQYPTPTGRFFVALFAQAPNPAYGPFVVVTSAFANTVTDWEQGGNAMVAITGPLDTLTAIQAGGAQLSHEGIRLLDGDMARLRVMPAGTPIDVVATLIPPRRLGASAGHRRS